MCKQMIKIIIGFALLAFVGAEQAEDDEDVLVLSEQNFDAEVNLKLLLVQLTDFTANISYRCPGTQEGTPH